MGLTIGVLGASGGLGVSTLVAALAVRAHVVLAGVRLSVGVDLDPRGGLETTMCLEHLPGRRWSDLDPTDWTGSSVPGRLRPATLPGTDGVHVLSGAPVPDRPQVEETLDDLAASCDAVVVDAPGRDGGSLLHRLDLLVVLARATARGATDLGSLRALPLDRTAPVLVTRGERTDRHGVVLAQEMGLPLLAHLVDDTAVRRQERQGIAPGLMRSAVDGVADEILVLAAGRPLQAFGEPSSTVPWSE